MRLVTAAVRLAAAAQATILSTTMLSLAVAQFKPALGDYGGNVQRIGTLLRQLAERPEPPALLLLPEAAMSGYLVEGGVRDVAVTAGTLFDDLSAQHQLSGAPPLDVVVGFYERWRDRLVGFPMADPALRSLNLSTCVALAVYEVLRRRS